MRTEDFQYLQTLLRQRSGLVVAQDKAYLLQSRLMPVARKWRLKGLEDLVAQARGKRQEMLLRDITEAMTTNESSFFRDTRPFDLFRSHVLPKFIESRRSSRKLRIWSAACSSGQEAYSLAMVLKEAQALVSGWEIEILGTDLSSEMISKAREGVFTQFEVQRGLPITHLLKYFSQRGDRWEITSELREMVSWRQFNLLDDLAPLGRFDVVFCRNVLIYFDQPTKTKVLDAIGRTLSPDGLLFLGGAETVLGISEQFRPLEGLRGLYEQTGIRSATASHGLVGAKGFAAG